MYYYSKSHNTISILHKGRKNPLFLDEDDNCIIPSGRFSTQEIKNSFFNSPQIVFEVTELCNLSCDYCCFGDLYYTPRNESVSTLDFANAKGLLDYYRENTDEFNKSDLHPLTISFYGGEGLLNFNLIKKIIAYAESIFHNLKYAMTTNAVLLDKCIDYLVEKDFQLLISLDGDEIHNQYRVHKDRKESFKKVYQNCQFVKENYPIFFEKNVNFNSVFHSRSSIESIYRFFDSNFNKIPFVSEVNENNIPIENKDKFKNLYSSAIDSFKKTKKSKFKPGEIFKIDPSTHGLIMFVRYFSNNFFNSYWELFRDLKNIVYVPTGTCLPFSRKIFLTTNGEILPCERINRRHPLGTVKQGLVNIDFESIKDIYDNIYDKYREQCAKCHGGGFCSSCIFNDISIDDKVLCSSFKTKKQLENYISRNLGILNNTSEYYEYIDKNTIIE